MSASDVASKRQASGRWAMFQAIIFTASPDYVALTLRQAEMTLQKAPLPGPVIQVSYQVGSQTASALIEVEEVQRLPCRNYQAGLRRGHLKQVRIGHTAVQEGIKLQRHERVRMGF
jgi:hypothetical protein